MGDDTDASFLRATKPSGVCLTTAQPNPSAQGYAALESIIDTKRKEKSKTKILLDHLLHNFQKRFASRFEFLVAATFGCLRSMQPYGMMWITGLAVGKIKLVNTFDQYSSANMIVITRSVTVGSAKSGYLASHSPA